jgi:hypothetical protein
VISWFQAFAFLQTGQGVSATPRWSAKAATEEVEAEAWEAKQLAMAEDAAAASTVGGLRAGLGELFGGAAHVDSP